jgi:crotonobetainyl-CoA:carnitine CoA-transferase CaiB-like acyl-CoA transferase
MSASGDDDPAARAPSGPLVGVVVLDLTLALAGPYSTQILADLGADVIKVESPEGDTTRYLGPGHHDDRSGMFVNVNRGKRSVALDLKRPAGRAALVRLAADADVLVHSIRRPALERLQLTYDDLRAVNPSIIFASLSGFGRGGPYADLPAYDDVVQAVTGLATLQGRLQGGEPTYVATVVADKAAGLTMVYAILAALFHRERTGEGQEIEVPIFETLASFVLLEHIAGAAFDPPMSPPVYGRAVSAERRPYRTSDGYLSVLIYNDGQWSRFFSALGDPEWSRDPRFASMRTRTDHVDFVLGALSAVLETRTTAEWLELLRAAEIPAMPVATIDDLFTDPHLERVGFWQRFDVDGVRLRLAGIPATLSRTPGAAGGAAPGLGEHGAAVLTEHGFTPEEIDALVDDGALVDGSR